MRTLSSLPLPLCCLQISCYPIPPRVYRLSLHSISFSSFHFLFQYCCQAPCRPLALSRLFVVFFNVITFFKIQWRAKYWLFLKDLKDIFVFDDYIFINGATHFFGKIRRIFYSPPSSLSFPDMLKYQGVLLLTTVKISFLYPSALQLFGFFSWFFVPFIPVTFP